MKQTEYRHRHHQRLNYYFPQFQYHNTLDSRLWLSSGEMRTLVANALKLLVNNHILYLRRIRVPLPDNCIHDILIHGSTTNYYYTHDSDIDICVIVDMDAVRAVLPTLDIFSILRAAVWHWRRNYDISICGMQVDVEFVDVHTPEYGNRYKPGSTYSLTQNKWLEPPVILLPDDVTRMKKMARQKYFEYRKMYKRIVRDDMGPDFIETFIQRLTHERKESLIDMPQHGTNPTVLAFRMIRKSGIYDKLRVRAVRKRSKNFNLSF